MHEKANHLQYQLLCNADVKTWYSYNYNLLDKDTILFVCVSVNQHRRF